MIDFALHTRLEPFADGRRVRHSFAARTGPPISIGLSLLLATAPAAYWLNDVASLRVAVAVAAALVITGLAVLSRAKSFVVMSTDGEVVVMRSRLLLPDRPRQEVKRIPTPDADVVVRTSPWGFAQATVDGVTYEVVSRDFTNAHAMGQRFDTGPRYSMGLTESMA